MEVFKMHEERDGKKPKIRALPRPRRASENLKNVPPRNVTNLKGTVRDTKSRTEKKRRERVAVFTNDFLMLGRFLGPKRRWLGLNFL
jgi:hypothetical protein